MRPKALLCNPLNSDICNMFTLLCNVAFGRASVKQSCFINYVNVEKTKFHSNFVYISCFATVDIKRLALSFLKTLKPFIWCRKNMYTFCSFLVFFFVKNLSRNWSFLHSSFKNCSNTMRFNSLYFVSISFILVRLESPEVLYFPN